MSRPRSPKAPSPPRRTVRQAARRAAYRSAHRVARWTRLGARGHNESLPFVATITEYPKQKRKQCPCHDIARLGPGHQGGLPGCRRNPVRIRQTRCRDLRGTGPAVRQARALRGGVAAVPGMLRQRPAHGVPGRRRRASGSIGAGLVARRGLARVRNHRTVPAVSTITSPRCSPTSRAQTPGRSSTTRERPWRGSGRAASCS